MESADRTVRGSALALAALLAGASALAADWPQWRGPSRDGVATGVVLPGRLADGLKQLWQAEVGEGHASPVVADRKVVVLSRQTDNEAVTCLNAADGKVVWTDSYEAPYKPQSVAKAHGKGPFATPTIAGGKVVAFGVTGVLTCYDLASGKKLWRKDFAGEFEKPHPAWGVACSPVIEGNLCIAAVGTKSDGGLAAFQMADGSRVWKQFDDGAAYSSPVVAMFGDKPQLVVLLHSHVVGVAPLSGKLLWKKPFVVQYEQNIITPLPCDGLVVISGWRQPTTAYRVAAAAEVAWTNDGDSMFMSSPVARGKHLYALSDREKGSLVCLSLDDGKAVWSSPGGLGPYASLVLAGDKLLVLTVGGELLMAAADPAGYKELGRVRVTDRPVWSHLAIAEGRLYVKDNARLTCVEMPKP